MKLSPGTPLIIGLLTNEAAPPQPVGRLAMAGGVAQLEWSAEAVAAGQGGFGLSTRDARQSRDRTD